MGHGPSETSQLESDNEQSHQYNEPDNNSDNSQYDDHAEAGESGQDERYVEGEPLTFIRVRFPGNAKSQPFLLGKRSFVYGQKVLAMSDRGMTVGYINSFPYERPFTKSMLPLRTISKAATQEELERQNSLIKQEKEAASACHRLIEKYKLDMNLTHVEFMQFGKKVVFYFNAPARVDFRELVKELVGELRMRVELRQISVRDRTAALGAIGACGLQTCCSSFLKNYGHVSIKMAKNQNLALIPSKINGVCGQIKCCIKYEDDVYTDKRSLLPREGEFIQTKNGDCGRVDRLHIFIEQFEMLTDRGVRRKYARNQYDSEMELPKDWKFPERFEHITNETSSVIGLAEEEKLQALRYQELWDEDELDEEDIQDSEAEENDDDNSDSDEESNDDSAEEEQNDGEQKEGTTQEEGPQENQENTPPKRNRPRRNRKRRRGGGGGKGPGGQGPA